MTASDVAAWWGALIATVVLIWDIFKWSKEGPTLDVDVTPNMKVVGDPLRQADTYIAIRATNSGDLPTTITNVGLKHFKNRLAFLRGRPDSQWIVVKPDFARPLPYLVAPGDIWDGGALQDERALGLMSKGLLYCYVFHSASKRPVRRLVRAPEPHS